jgi:hypothetical protein
MSVLQFSSQGHGYRKDLASMLANINPKFFKFPGLSYYLSSFICDSYQQVKVLCLRTSLYLMEVLQFVEPQECTKLYDTVNNIQVLYG